MDFSNYNGIPVFKQAQILSVTYPVLLKNFSQAYQIYLRHNTIQRWDNYVMFFNQQINQYYDVSFIEQHQKPQNKNNLIQASMLLDSQQRLFTRKVFSMENVIVSIGSIFTSLTVILTIIMNPISHHIFNINALKYFYLAKTSDKLLFQQTQLQENTSKTDIDKVLNKFQPIKILNRDKLFLFCYNSFFQKIFERFQPKISQINKLYQKGTKLLNSQMNIIKILRKLRETQSILKYILVNPEIYKNMKYMKHNTINLSSSEEEEHGFEYKENQGQTDLKLKISMLKENKQFLNENSTVQILNDYILFRINKDIEKDRLDQEIKKENSQLSSASKLNTERKLIRSQTFKSEAKITDNNE